MNETSNTNSDKAMSTSNYNFEEVFFFLSNFVCKMFVQGRLQASIKWLITRIYNDQNQLPDSLCEPFKLNNEVKLKQVLYFYKLIQGRIELTSPVIFSLVNGSFYCQAAAKIFQDPSFLHVNLDFLLVINLFLGRSKFTLFCFDASRY